MSAAAASYSAALRIDRGWRQFFDAQEVGGGGRIVFQLVRLFALLVDGRSQSVDDGRARLVLGRRQCEHPGIRLLGIRVLGQINR